MTYEQAREQLEVVEDVVRQMLGSYGLGIFENQQDDGYHIEINGGIGAGIDALYTPQEVELYCDAVRSSLASYRQTIIGSETCGESEGQ